MTRVASPILLSLALMVTSLGCTTARVTSTGGPDIGAAQAEAYDGPKARVAVAKFTNRSRGGGWNAGVGDGMTDMMSTALFNTNRYIVLERGGLREVMAEQDLGASGRVRRDTAAPIGQIEGAELLVTGAVTEFQVGTGGGGGGLSGPLGNAGRLGEVVGGVRGGVRSSHVAIDIRVVDARTSRLVAATSVEADAHDVDMGTMARTSRYAGTLGGYSKTPVEKAVRKAIEEAVRFVVSKTPTEYYHYR